MAKNQARHTQGEKRGNKKTRKKTVGQGGETKIKKYFENPRKRI